jgi:copper transport protein
LPKTDRTARSRAARLTLVLVVATQLALVVVPGPVRAHALLLDADPAPNSVVPESPATMTLFFSEAVDPRSVSLRILSSEQQPIVGVGAPILDGSGRLVRATLPDLEPDTYTVEYAVVSAVDGHLTAQIYAFVVDPTGTQPPPSISIPTEPTTPPDPLGIAARWVATVAAILLAGTGIVWLLHRAWIGAEDRAPVPWTVLAALAFVALIGLVTTVARAAAAAFAHAHAQLTGLPFDPLAPFGFTPYGIAMRIALGGAVAAMVIAGTAGSGATRGRLLLVGAAAGVTLIGLSLTGHAAALGGPVGAAVDTLHLFGIAAWLGAIPALVLLGRYAGARLPAFAAHARVALVAAPLVILTGLANSPLVVGDARELTASGYGNLLLTKALIASLALGVGAANFFLARGASPRRMTGLAVGEVALAAVAVLVGTTMVSIQPAIDRGASAVDPRLGVAHLYAEGGESSVHGIVNLPEPGVQSYSFAVADAETGAGREDVAQLVVTFVPPPDSDLPPATEVAQPAQQPWIWTLNGAFTPVVGTWDLEILVRRGRLVEDRMTVPLNVRQVVRPLAFPPPTTGSQMLGALASPTAGFPEGAAGWAIPAGLFGIAAATLAIERWRSPRPGSGRRILRAIRIGTIVAAVAVGVSLLARDVVAVTNQPPVAWVNASNPLADDPEAAAAGEDVYRANCVSCHGPTGAGDGPAADGLARPPTDLAGIVPHRLDGELAWTIAAGVAGTQMPAFGTTLLEGERWELLSFLRSRWPYEPSEAPP